MDRQTGDWRVFPRIQSVGDQFFKAVGLQRSTNALIICPLSRRNAMRPRNLQTCQNRDVLGPAKTHELGAGNSRPTEARERLIR